MGDPSQLGECGLVGDVLSIIYRPVKLIRNITLRTDNQIAMDRVPRARSNSPTPNRLLQHLCLVCLVYGADVLPVYIRSERNFAAAKLARWSDEEVAQRYQQEGMKGANAARALWKSMDLY